MRNKIKNRNQLRISSHYLYTGNGCHQHLNVTNAADGNNAFTGDENTAGSDAKCSPLLKHFLAG
jgi:glutamine synthetase